jgi:hypothetical protein
MANKAIFDLTKTDRMLDDDLLVVQQASVARAVPASVLKAWVQEAAVEAALGLARDGEALVLNGAPIVIGHDNYGNALPQTATEGQLFFLLG